MILQYSASSFGFASGLAQAKMLGLEDNIICVDVCIYIYIYKYTCIYVYIICIHSCSFSIASGAPQTVERYTVLRQWKQDSKISIYLSLYIHIYT